MTKDYRSKDGSAMFRFHFTQEGDQIAVWCLSHPPLQAGRDPSPQKTHLFPSGRLCFAVGHEPHNQARAQELARQWAEYFLQYRKSGEAQY